MATDLYDQMPAHSAAIQLYARSGQLPVAKTMFDRKQLQMSQCQSGCLAAETVHHLFAQCTHYNKWRTLARDKIITQTKRGSMAMISLMRNHERHSDT